MFDTTRSSTLFTCFALCIAGGALASACGSEQGEDQEEESSKSEEDSPEDSKEASASKGAKNNEDQGEQSSTSSEQDDKEDPDEKESSPEPSADPMPWFKFFATSQDGLLELAEDKKNGFGGDLGGLAGADALCKKLALRGNPKDKKIWRAFLSATSDNKGEAVHAIERVGEGPWHDFNHRLLANNPEELLPGKDRRPKGADPQLAEMFTDELGRPISSDTSLIDNHDMLTGSDRDGRLPSGSSKAETCNDWTSKSTKLGRPRIGHAWPRSSRSGREWIYDHRAGGCGAGIDTEKKSSNGTPTVGSGGGYGGFYCFAL